MKGKKRYQKFEFMDAAEELGMFNTLETNKIKKQYEKSKSAS